MLTGDCHVAYAPRNDILFDTKEHGAARKLLHDFPYRVGWLAASMICTNFSGTRDAPPMRIQNTRIIDINFAFFIDVTSLESEIKERVE